MREEAAFRQYLQRWLESDQHEPPVLLHGSDAAHLKEALETAARHEGCEVVRAEAAGATIPISAVRALTNALARTTFYQRRLVIIEEAERLSLPAAQALLKPLEEQALTTRILLTTLAPRRLPATIRSRCQAVRLTPSGQSPGRGEGEMEQLAAELSERLRREGPSAELKLAYQRLRDYYHIVSSRGNEKLAREVALAYRPRGEDER